MSLAAESTPSTMEDLETIREFLIESNENLMRLDQEIVELEKDPTNTSLVASIFRTIHTIKGTCGFLGFDTLTGVSHAAETLLSQVRDGKRRATKPLIDITLESVDAIKEILASIESTNAEGSKRYPTLLQRLQLFAESSEADEALANAYVPTPVVSAPQLSASDTAAIHALAELGRVQSLHGGAVSETHLPESKVDKGSDRDPNEGSSKSSGPTGVSDSTVRVDVSLLDKLMNLVGELVLARNQVLQHGAKHDDAIFAATSQRLNLITSELQEGVMKTRMQPIGIVWNKFPRVVRDLASELGKQIQLVMEGADTELDRTIIEAIKDPLTHIIRNSCDHGIEIPADRQAKGKQPGGRLLLRAFHEGGHVNIEITDDGKGIDPEKIKGKAVQKGLITPEQAARMSERDAVNTIFLPGFSTADKISNISGRGVGMDVVKTNIERIGGVVDLVAGNGTGTSVKVKIPLTLAIIPGLIVSVSEERFVIPQMSLCELIRLEGKAVQQGVEYVQNVPVYRRRGRLLPLVFLNEALFGFGRPLSEEDVINIVVVQAEGRDFGLVVDTINDTQEIVVKPLGKHLKNLEVYSGATIMGDGNVALILDVLGVAQHAALSGSPNERPQSTDADEQIAVEGSLQSLLIFAAGKFGRLTTPLSLVARLEELPVSTLEWASGNLVVQYRGEILPLVHLASQLDRAAELQLPQTGSVSVVVFANGKRLIGLIVDRIVDIVQDQMIIKRRSRNRLLLGSAVIGGKVTDFLDLPAVLETGCENIFDGNAEHESELLAVEPQLAVARK